jgi:plasmid maintenance system killer protein
MQVSVKDKRVKAVMASPAGARVKGLQPNEAERIRVRVTVLIAAPTLKAVSDAHPEWRVHRWKGKAQWSIDVLANTRLLFDYDVKGHAISGMTYDDPH